MYGNSYHKVSPIIFSSANLLRYRIKRIADRSIPDMLSYLQYDYDPPDEWMENADDVFNACNERAWNRAKYTTPSLIGSKSINLFINQKKKRGKQQYIFSIT